MGELSSLKLKEAIKEAIQKINTVEEIEVKTKNDKNVVISFRYKEIIGRGTFGVVILVEDINTGEEWALKRVYQDLRYYNREVSILKAMEHENIINLKYFYYKETFFKKTHTIERIFYDIDDVYLSKNRDSRHVYLNLVFLYYPHTLENVPSPLSYVNFRSLFRQALLGLHYMHSKNICHRDIKPANVLIDDNLKLKICDFGNAKELHVGKSHTSYICSRFYRSPENVFGMPNYTCKVDIWSLGCVFAELATQKILFDGDSNDDQKIKITNICRFSDEDRVMYKYVGPCGDGIDNYLNKFGLDEELIEVFIGCFYLNPEKRKTTGELLQMRYFID